MAIRFDSGGECLFRASNLPASTAFTACGWFNKRGSGGTTLSTIAIIVPSSGGGYIGAYSTVDGSKFGIQTDTSAGMVSGGAVTDNQWYFVAMSGAGTGATDAKLRYAAHGASSLTTVANNGSSFTSAYLVVGMNNAEYWGNQTVAGWKVFDRALTDAELLNEMYRLTPASTTNLNSWSPMFHSTVADAAKDYSGNGNNWITNGTLSLEDGPPVSWGARLLTVGAVVIPAATGSLAATETGADTASLSGDVLVAGALAVTETGADTAALVGDVLVTGTLAATESGSDTAALTGDVLVGGALAVTETGADTAALAGDVLIDGALAAVESGADTAAFSGAVPVVGTLAATETGSDTAALAGYVPVLGLLAATETGADTAALAGEGVTIASGSLAAIESGSDTAALTGAILVSGVLAATEIGADTATFYSSVPAQPARVRRGGPTRRISSYSMRIGGWMVYADSPQALQAAIEEFEDKAPERAKSKAKAVAAKTPQIAPKKVGRSAPRLSIVDAPQADLVHLRAEIAAANERIRQLYEREARSALLAAAIEVDMRVRAADDEAAWIALES